MLAARGNRTIDSTINRTHNHAMPALTANDLKTRGIAAIEESLAHQPEAVISVRGQQRFVVMEVAQYQYLRECELEAALAESRADEAAGRYVIESAQAHKARLDARLKPKSPAVKAPTGKRKQGPKTVVKSRRPTSTR